MPRDETYDKIERVSIPNSEPFELIGGQIAIKLEVKEDAQYGASNEVKGFKSVSGSAAPAANVPPFVKQAEAAQAATSKAAPPWAKK